MKLLYCSRCRDVVKLQLHLRTCECGASQGVYDEDGRNVTISGDDAMVIGLDNFTIGIASHMAGYGKSGDILNIDAFFFPREHERIERKEVNNG